MTNSKIFTQYVTACDNYKKLLSTPWVFSPYKFARKVKMQDTHDSWTDLLNLIQIVNFSTCGGDKIRSRRAISPDGQGYV